MPFLALLVALGVFPETCFGIGHDRFVATKYEPGDFILVENGAAAPLAVDPNDYPGVTRAANDLSRDILRVTGVAPRLLNAQGALEGRAVIIATLGRSALLDRLIGEHKFDAAALEGKWESYLIETVTDPLP